MVLIRGEEYDATAEIRNRKCAHDLPVVLRYKGQTSGCNTLWLHWTVHVQGGQCGYGLLLDQDQYYYLTGPELSACP